MTMMSTTARSNCVCCLLRWLQLCAAESLFVFLLTIIIVMNVIFFGCYARALHFFLFLLGAPRGGVTGRPAFSPPY